MAGSKVVWLAAWMVVNLVEPRVDLSEHLMVDRRVEMKVGHLAVKMVGQWVDNWVENLVAMKAD